MGIRLQDKTALLPGATTTIGRAIVTAFAAEAHMLSSAAAAGARQSARLEQVLFELVAGLDAELAECLA
jgi:NAD(P)-dependent dehydrogenase (short-subunit alcohol dehydrogenase family)